MIKMQEIRFREPPAEDDPYREVDPRLAYAISKGLVDMGLDDPAKLEQQYVVTEVIVPSPDDGSSTT